MDRKLIDAAQKGDIHKLHNLIKDHPFILKLVSLSSGDTPLHIACIGGHVKFVKEILTLNPEFATELNQDGFSPMHVASANGDIEIVKELLKIGSHLCLIKGKEMRIPLHSAIVKGRKQVIQELLMTCLDSITELTARDETCFHLAVKNNQFETFKILMDHVILQNKLDILNMKDRQGNFILHLAAYRKHYEVIHMLLGEKSSFNGSLEVNSINGRGLSPLDVLVSEGGDSEIEEMFGLVRASSVHSPNPNVSSSEPRPNQSKWPSKKLQDYFKYDKIKDSPTKVRNTLLVLAILIAAATYQPVLSPPGGVWQDDFSSDSSNKTKHTAGQAVMGTNSPVSYGLFLFFNSIGFFMSLHMLSYLTLGLPLRFELGVALFALTATYDTCMIAITPGGTIVVLFIVLSTVMPILMPVLTNLVRDYQKLRQCVLPSRCTSA